MIKKDKRILEQQKEKKSFWSLDFNSNKPKVELKEIRETKCTCKACGNFWFYGKTDENEEKMNKLHNASKALACCGGCLPALFIKEKEVRDLDKCFKCGSKAVKKETVIHNV